MPTVHQSADVRFPLAGKGYVVSVTSSSQRTQLTGSSGVINADSDKIFTWKADGGTVYLTFGNSAVTVDDTAGSGATVPVYFLKDGESIDRALPDVSGEAGGSYDLYVAYKTAAGTAKLRFSPSSGK